MNGCSAVIGLCSYRYDICGECGGGPKDPSYEEVAVDCKGFRSGGGINADMVRGHGHCGGYI